MLCLGLGLGLGVILYLRAGANKLSFFQMKGFYGLPA